MNKKKNIISLVILFLGISFIISGLLFPNSDTNNDSINLNDIEIKNKEIETLFSYVQPNVYTSVCLGFFYQNPFKNYDLEDKISLLLNTYTEELKKEIDDVFLDKISSEDERNTILNTSMYYIEVDIIKKAMKEVFNIELNNYTFDEDKNYHNYKYLKEVNAFIDIPDDNKYLGQILQQIIDYKEKKNEIALTIVKAEIVSNEENSQLVNGAYRYSIKENTLVLKDVNDDNFYFTKDNIDQFPQIKYVFKKNKNGKYYVSDIINLNYEEDYEKCN